MVEYCEDKKASHIRRTELTFGDIVGQDELKQALLAAGANDDLDGLLIQGEKGTAKSTAVRALTNYLPTQAAIEDCPYGCPPNAPTLQCADCRTRTDPPTTERPVPLVTLPLGATRERIVGTLSVADALDGDYEFDPGLLARANRGILYVDEVNLLDDHLVDVLLDAAASGVNRVERDSMSVSHPAEFTLIGTMNPEEGDLRPQLRDRFALCATVTACNDIDQRVKIIDRALGRNETQDGVRAQAEDRRDQLRQARDRLDRVELSREFTEEIAECCRNAGVDGHRGDIATARTARTFAALDKRSNVIQPDVRRAAELALPHRLQSRPFEDTPDSSELIGEHFDSKDDGESESSDEETEGEPEHGDGDESDRSDERDGSGRTDDTEGSESMGTPEPSSGTEEDTPETGTDGETEPQVDAGASTDDENDHSTKRTPLVPGQSRASIGEARAPDISTPEAVDAQIAETGSRSRARPSVDNDGPRVRIRSAESSHDIDAAASIRAATSRGATSVGSRDLRQSVRRSDAAALVLFVVDASASMRPAMRAAKGTVLELLKDAYQQRDEVGFVTFSGEGADVLLPPTDSVSLAARHLKDLPTGDRTPLPAGLRTAREVLDRANPATSVVVLITDGRANVAEGSPVGETREAAETLADSGTQVLVVDASNDEQGGVTEVVIDKTGGERIPLSALSAERIDTIMNHQRN
ncbi:VWA domain-containing protein [Halococcus thailandensis]|uniref:Protporphyrin IX magnesium chelatase n=1 Tax=Halococcus thailandensis JCM 13552 TaxID=1227457 RepID=M0NEL2_9EURY|nr:VWA domain-containing protein [Halococcus thailandensis]EMA56427.1 protporphyrin IX magnesium chelatase [Halococcus thailandensis JCM 13552]